MSKPSNHEMVIHKLLWLHIPGYSGIFRKKHTHFHIFAGYQLKTMKPERLVGKYHTAELQSMAERPGEQHKKPLLERVFQVGKGKLVLGA